MATFEESENIVDSTRIPLWQKELIERRKHVSKVIANPTDEQSRNLMEDTPETNTSTNNGVMTNTTAVVASNETDTIEEDTYTTGHSHSEQLAQHQTSSSSSTTPSPQATNTSAKTTFTAEPSSVQEINIQSHSRHGNERFASDSNSEYTSTALSGVGKKCTYSKNSNLVNKSNISVNKYTKFSERIQLKSPATMVAMPELLSENNNLDDTSEELQYGPGIVSKLRCRYLSLALRQSSSKQRPSLDNLRRATSLNNLIDEEDEQHVSTNGQTWNHQERINLSKEKARTPDEYIPSFHREHNEQNGDRCRPSQRGNDSSKLVRARSVEALMRYDQSAWQRDINKDSIDQTATMVVLEEIANENTKVNSVTDVVTIEDKIVQARERGEPKPKRLTSFMDETERPPPDLVKHTLRIFEASANRRPRIGTKGNGGVAAKVASYKTIIMQEKPQIVFPKPPLSPKKPVIKPRTSSPKQVLNGGRYTNGNGADLNKIPTIDINVAKSNFESPTILSPNTNGSKKITDTSRSPSPLAVRVDMAYRTNKFESPLSPVQTSREKTNGQSSYTSSPLSPVSAAPRPMPRQELLRPAADINAQNNIATDSPLTALGKKLETLAIESPKNGISKFNLSDIESDETDSNYNDTADDSDVDRPSKRISKTALDNISKAGVTTEFNFSAQSSKSYLPAGPLNPLNGNCSTPIKTNSCDTTEQNVRQIGIIRPQVKTSVQSVTATIPPPKVINKKDNQSVVINDSVGVEEKPNRDKLLITNLTSPANILLTTREIEQNLINKEKSDEIKWATKNNSVPIAKPWQKQEQNNTMVFNFSNKKDVPDYIEKFENDGLVVRRKRDWTKPGESGFVMLGDLTVETSTDPDDSYPLGPPSPCDVEFQNDNVIIDGKSSLKDKSIDRKLKIHFNESLTSIFEYPSESSMLADDVDNSAMVSGLLGSMALGSAPLGSYTPVKASIATSFELGVTRSQSPSVESSAASTNGESSESLQYLKPATDEQTVAWSEGTRVTDLLF
ncbi:hypothetical protein HA402_012384 [Bradysia odoriphaga]|nr:hypothetical protein HA402_012384 [Bradysia odoriphaga]